MTESGKPEKRDAKVKRIIKSPDLSKCERIQIDSKTIKFLRPEVKPIKKKR